MGSVFDSSPLKLYSPTKRYIPKITKHEESLQKMVAHYMRLQYPFAYFHSDYGAGLRLTMNQAKIQRSMQSGKGWPDMFIAYPSRGYHGLFLELKKDNTAIYVTKGPRKGQLVANPHIQAQAHVIKDLNSLGYFARFGVGFDNCQKIIDWYFKKANNASIF